MAEIGVDGLLSDALSSFFVIVASIAIAVTHWAAFDLIASLVIALLMIWSGIGVLNVAGPRESQRPGIGPEARAFLERLFRLTSTRA